MNGRLSKLWGLWLRFWRSRVRNFSIIGIALTVGGAIYIAIVVPLGISKEDANTHQAIASIILNFALNYKKTWPDRRQTWVIWQMGRYGLAKIATLRINMWLFSLTLIGFQKIFGPSIEVLGISLMSDFLFAYLFSTGVIMYLNYFIMDKFVFGERGFFLDIIAMILAMITWPFKAIVPLLRPRPHKEN